MKGNKLSDYYSEVGSFRGAIKIKGKWESAKDLNRIDKHKMCRWHGPPSKAISNAMKLPPMRADVLLPYLAIKKEKERKSHLRPSMEMGRTKCWRTFCGMTHKLYLVTENPKEVTCKKCINKMINKPTHKENITGWTLKSVNYIFP